MKARHQYARLSPADKRTYLEALGRSHRVCTRVLVMDASEDNVRDISHHVTGGQVDFDATQVPHRSLSITILDPEYKLALTGKHSPAFGNLHAASLIQVWYDVLVTALDAWVSAPVFCGPVVGMQRGGQEVTINAVSKEAFLQAPNAYNNVFSRTAIESGGRTAKSNVKAILAAVGEPRALDWQTKDHDMPRQFNPVKFFRGRNFDYLALINRIIGKRNKFFYSPSGRPFVRPRTHDAVLNLSKLQLTEPNESVDLTNVVNRARTKVTHKTTRRPGAPPNIFVTVVLKPSDPLSAQSLARGDTPRYRDAVDTSNGFKTREAAKSAALKMLTQADNEQVTLDIIPCPILDMHSRIRVERTNGAPVTFVVRQFSFPLSTGDSMSVGYQRRLLDPKHTKARFRTQAKKHRRKRG